MARPATVTAAPADTPRKRRRQSGGRRQDAGRRRNADRPNLNPVTGSGSADDTVPELPVLTLPDECISEDSMEAAAMSEPEGLAARDEAPRRTPSPGSPVSMAPAPGTAAVSTRRSTFVPTDVPDETDERASDARVIEAVRAGEGDAFGVLVRRYERRLARVIGRFIADADLIEDLTQETFLRTYERLEQYDASRRFGPWLFRVGVNLTLDHLRKKRRRRWVCLFSEQTSPVDDGRSYDPGVDDPRPAVDLQQEVRHVLEEVSEKYRTVLILRDLENFSTSEIAAILDRKEATIRWRLSEARSQFEAAWSQRQRRLEGMSS